MNNNKIKEFFEDIVNLEPSLAELWNNPVFGAIAALPEILKTKIESEMTEKEVSEFKNNVLSNPKRSDNNLEYVTDRLEELVEEYNRNKQDLLNQYNSEDNKLKTFGFDFNKISDFADEIEDLADQLLYFQNISYAYDDYLYKLKGLSIMLSNAIIADTDLFEAFFLSTILGKTAEEDNSLESLKSMFIYHQPAERPFKTRINEKIKIIEYRLNFPSNSKRPVIELSKSCAKVDIAEIIYGMYDIELFTKAINLSSLFKYFGTIFNQNFDYQNLIKDVRRRYKEKNLHRKNSSILKKMYFNLERKYSE